MPVIYIEIDRLLALTVQGASMTISNDGIDTQGILIGHIEAERCNVRGDGNTEVVGINIWLHWLLLGITYRLVGTGSKQQGEEGDEHLFHGCAGVW